MDMDPLLVGTDWLEQRLGAEDLVVIDGSWHMPETKRDAAAEHVAHHIPGAIFFDIDAIVDRDSKLPHMLPPPLAFAAAMRQLGVGDAMKAVVYDSLGLFSAPRVWWTLKTFGLEDVHVLDGGLPKWTAEGRPLDDGPVARPAATFTPRVDPSAVADAAAVLRALHDGATQIVDARPANRFCGTAPEPRPGLRCGHIPGSLNLPWTDLVLNGRLRRPEELRAAFERRGVQFSRPITTTCGSGVSAAILSFALASLGRQSALYDGSWSEWGGLASLPVETS